MSRGRAGKVNTLKWIPKSWLGRTQVLVPKKEYLDYANVYGSHLIYGVPEEVDNYSKKVQFIMQAKRLDLNDKAVILDDDLVFSSKIGGKLITIRSDVGSRPDRLGLFEQIEDLLDEYPLVGVHPRQMGQNAAPPYALNGRIICIQGINRNVVSEIKVDQFPILADVVLNCTLLARGCPNALVTTYFQDHGPCQAPGGCSIYRTPDMQRDAVEYLAARFPGYVKLVVRRPKVAKWMGDVRYDYTCQWKKLYAAGLVWQKGKGPSPDMETDDIAALDAILKEANRGP